MRTVVFARLVPVAVLTATFYGVVTAQDSPAVSRLAVMTAPLSALGVKMPAALSTSPSTPSTITSACK